MEVMRSHNPQPPNATANTVCEIGRTLRSCSCVGIGSGFYPLDTESSNEEPELKKLPQLLINALTGKVGTGPQRQFRNSGRCVTPENLAAVVPVLEKIVVLTLYRVDCGSRIFDRAAVRVF